MKEKLTLQKNGNDQNSIIGLCGRTVIITRSNNQNGQKSITPKTKQDHNKRENKNNLTKHGKTKGHSSKDYTTSEENIKNANANQPGEPISKVV